MDDELTSQGFDIFGQRVTGFGIGSQGDVFGSSPCYFPNINTHVSTPTLFTKKEAEHCPGNWIAICENEGCSFSTRRIPASGIEEAKKVALERHSRTSNPNNFEHSRYCSAPEIVVGRVPDE